MKGKEQNKFNNGWSVFRRSILLRLKTGHARTPGPSCFDFILFYSQILVKRNGPVRSVVAGTGALAGLGRGQRPVAVLVLVA
jgi:hypothetical protein